MPRSQAAVTDTSTTDSDAPAPREGVVIIAVLLGGVAMGALLTATDRPAYPYDRAIGSLVVLVGALAVGWTWARLSRARYRAPLVVALVGTISFLVLAVLFRHTMYGLNGIAGDAWFTTAMVTKAAHGQLFGDYSYLELSAFYPPLYHQLLGLAADIGSIEPARAVKPGFLAVALVLPVSIYRAWRSLTTSTVAVVVGVLFALGAPKDLVYKPFEVLSAALVVPWWLYYVEGLGPAVRRRGFVIWGGLAGGLLFLLYYYWFFVLGAWWLLRVGYRAAKQRAIAEPLRRASGVLGVAALVSAVFWAPLLLDLARHGLEPLQTHWLRPHMLELPIGSGLSIPSLVICAGLLYAVATARTDRVSRGVAHVAVAVLLWYALGLLGVTLESPLLHHKTRILLAYAGIAGFALSLRDLVPRLGARADLGVGAFLALGVFAFGGGFLRLREDATYETALEAAKKTPEDRYGEIRELDLAGKVFLTTDADLVALLPIHTFIGHNAHFSHPASRFKERLEFLRSLDWIRDGEALCWMLSHNRFAAVDYVYAKKGKLVVQDDDFPHERPAKRVEIQLRKRALDHACFRPTGRGLLKVEAPEVQIASEFSGRLRDLAVEYGTEEAAAVAASADGSREPDAYSLAAGDLETNACIKRKGGRATGRKCPAGVVVYGPYAPTPRGAHVRVRFTVRAGSEPIEASIDVVSNKGKREHGASSTVEIAAGEQTQLMHQAVLSKSVSDVEGRLIVRSKSGTVDLAVEQGVVEVYLPPSAK